MLELYELQHTSGSLAKANIPFFLQLPLHGKVSSCADITLDVSTMKASGSYPEEVMNPLPSFLLQLLLSGLLFLILWAVKLGQRTNLMSY